jgi:hypothetical protein
VSAKIKFDAEDSDLQLTVTPAEDSVYKNTVFCQCDLTQLPSVLNISILSPDGIPSVGPTIIPVAGYSDLVSNLWLISDALAIADLSPSGIAKDMRGAVLQINALLNEINSE